MAVQPHRNTWTDERLDDLSHSIRDGFARNDAEHLALREELRNLRGETREGFARVDCRIDGLEGRFDNRFEALDHRFDALQRTLILGLAGLAAAVIGAAATVASVLG